MKRFFYFILISAFVALTIGSAAFLYIIKDLPNLDTFDNRQIAQSSKIYDRSGEILLYELHGEEKRTVIPFSEIPDLAKKATLAIEDNDFYNHPAFDWKSILRAVLVNIKKGGVVQGGSTITQQLAKKAFLTDARTITRKIKELVLAFKLEKKYSKDQILELYLNQIPYGANSYGIEAASKTYFGKSTKELTLGEVAVLASLPQAPSFYSPWGKNKDRLIERKNLVLKRMLDLGYINENDFNGAKGESIAFLPQTTNIKAPHFVFTVIDYLNNQYGEDYIRTAGLKVVTTLDYSMQELAQKVVYEGAKRNEELYEGKNSALVAQDGPTGQILALVGSRDYFDEEIDGQFNVATQGLRQPGSTIKPFAYITAFKKGYTPDTVLFDLETEFDISGEEEKSYKPQNFDEVFRGPIKMKESLAQSVNVTSVKTLYLAGIDNVLKLVKDFGIKTLTERSRYGLSLVLGGGEVKLLDLVEAYSVFSQDGIKHKQNFILRIENSNGKVLEEYQNETDQVIEPQYPRLINNILSDVELRKSLFQNSLSLTTSENHEIALKTGTTNDYRDAWTVGYTPSLIVGVWAGNNDNSPMVKKGSSILAAIPIWSAFFKEVIKDKPQELFNKPEPILVEKPILRGEFVIDNQVHDILYYVNKRDPQGPKPEAPDNDSQFKNWEEPIAKWLEVNPLDKLITQNPAVVSGNNLRVDFLNPQKGTFISVFFIIEAKIYAINDITKTELFFNNQELSPNSPAQLIKTGENQYTYRAEVKITNADPQNILKIRVTDSKGASSESEVIVYK